MKRYTIIAGVNGTGKSSFRGVLEGQGEELGHIIDPDAIAGRYKSGEIAAGRQALSEIKECIESGRSLTQETTLSGHRTLKNIRRAKELGFTVVMYYIGLNSKYESIYRIANRVRKGGHDINPDDVSRRFGKRFDDLAAAAPLCDRIYFYDNENGFVKVAEQTDGVFRYTGDYRPDWIIEYRERSD